MQFSMIGIDTTNAISMNLRSHMHACTSVPMHTCRDRRMERHGALEISVKHELYKYAVPLSGNDPTKAMSHPMN